MKSSSNHEKFREELLNIIVLETGSDHRRRLVELLQALPEVDVVRTVRDVEQFCAICGETPGEFSMGIVGNPTSEQLLTTLRSVRKDAADLCPPLIAALRSKETDGPAVSSSYDAGANAFLLEPISGVSVSAVLDQLRKSEAFRTYKQRSAARLLRISMSFASKLIDQCAQSAINNQRTTGDTIREWKRLRSYLRSLGERVTPNDIVTSIAEECANAKPFPNRGIVRKPAKSRFIPATEVVNKLLAERGIPVEKLQEMVQIMPDELKLFLDGKISMSFPIAAELARVLGHDKEYWLNFK